VGKKRAPTTSDGVWAIHRGEPRPKSRAKARLHDVEPLTFNNPYGYEIERVWFDGKVIFAQRKLKRGTEPKRVKGQLNIYDSVPGMRGYSPIWQFNYVIVPRDYRPNTLRSEKDCLESGYPIKKSRVFEN
jgi:hypothetical protein